MPMTWNEQANTKLLLAIIHTSNMKIDYDKVAHYMGPECTTIAVRRHLQKLGEKAKSSADTAASDDTTTAIIENTPAVTPEKPRRGRGRPPKQKANELSPEETSPFKKQKNIEVAVAAKQTVTGHGSEGA